MADGARPWEAEAQAWTEGSEPTAEASAKRSAPPADIAVAELSTSGGYTLLELQRAYLLDAEIYLKNDNFSLAQDMARRADDILPGSPRSAWLLGEAYRLAGDEASARKAFEDYLGRFPPFGPNYHRAVTWLEEHGGAPVVDRPDLP